MTKVKNLTIPGPAGHLEAIVETPGGSCENLIGIICHPHPLYEGTMHNKVVTTLAKVFERLGAVTIRFNFRGVGKSEGQHDYAVGELDDLRAVIAWGEEHYPNHKLLLAGFSFGAYIATKVATEVNPTALISVAPAVHHNDYQQLPEIRFPWIVVQGEQDEVVPPNKVFDWIATLSYPPKVIRMPQASHFFHGQLMPLRDRLVDALQPIIDKT